MCRDDHEEGNLGGRRGGGVQRHSPVYLCASRCLSLEAPSFQYGGVPEGRPPPTAPRFLSEPSQRVKSDKT